MDIQEAVYVMSNTDYRKCPDPVLPEYAFIGRSNVGKSSLINRLTGKVGLAKTSQVPGKTQLISHFKINRSWYLVDLPGYGYAKVSKGDRVKWEKMIYDYLLYRPNLCCTFVLIDSRLPPQKNDLTFLELLGEKGIPFHLVFTKADKLRGQGTLEKNLADYRATLLETWEELPAITATSSESGLGRAELLRAIEGYNEAFVLPERDL
jgi:GTP-binding protein